jgi:hypothetical protein
VVDKFPQLVPQRNGRSIRDRSSSDCKPAA